MIISITETLLDAFVDQKLSQKPQT
jgi:hypothetical protein